MNQREFDTMVHFIAQGAVNITSGHTEVQPNSRIHRAMIKFCEAVHAGTVRFDGCTASESARIAAEEAASRRGFGHTGVVNGVKSVSDSAAFDVEMDPSEAECPHCRYANPPGSHFPCPNS